MKKLVNGTKQGDPIGVGDKIDITNGWDTTVLKEMDTQFKLEQTQHESTPGAKDGKWIIILPVI